MISWYLNRLKTMSPAEIVYRGNQFLQKKREKRNKTLLHQEQDFDKVFTEAVKNTGIQDPTPFDFAVQFKDYRHFDFFGLTLDLQAEINWHYDIQSGKQFPRKFSKDIDIRSGEYGSAKIVWEINRLQFLLPLAVKYKLSKEEQDLQHWMQLMRNWVSNNPYLEGINWYSNIEVNIRLIVWYYCWQILWSDQDVKANKEFICFTKEIWLPAIYDHCVYSISNPSKFSSANNHLIAEYSGLFVAAVCWPFKESSQWTTYAQNGLEKEIVHQHSDNGINREEAAEYIQFITDFFLIPLAVGQKKSIFFSNTYKTYIYKICDYILNLLDVKGGYAKYGDEDDGKVLVVSPDPHFNNFLSILISGAVLFSECKFKKRDNSFDFKNWLLWGGRAESVFNELNYAEEELKSMFYKAEGHFLFKKTCKADSEKEIYLHFDAAPLGFLSIAAHGHADALSVVLMLDGDPILIDAGTYTYHTEREWRRYFVSTAAHNTICIDHFNQAEYVGPTMWLSHYEPEILNISVKDGLEIISAKHNGYDKIGCSHQRTIVFDRQNELFVFTDEVDTDSKPHQILQQWHLHPQLIIEEISHNTFFLKHPQGKRKIRVEIDPLLKAMIVKGETAPILGWYSKSFLQKEKAPVFCCSFNSSTQQEKIIFKTSFQIM
jgi:hypothetical protein